MRKTLFALFAALLIAPTAASAQFYFGIHGGVNVLQDSQWDNAGGSSAPVADVEYKAGGTVGGVVGFRFPVGRRNHIEVEGEVTYRSNELDSYTDWWTGFDIPVTGKVNSTAYMANFWFNFGTGSRWTPYVGGGLGVADVETSGVVLGSTAFQDDSDTVWAGQLGGGVAFGITPNLSLTMDYRAFATEQPRFSNLGVDAEYLSSSLRVGLKLRL